MKLDIVSISNFKGIKAGKFNPTSFACLVGENNAGKSTVLQAIVTGLNRPSTISAEQHYDPDLPVEIILKFTGIDQRDLFRLADEHRVKIAELVDAGSFSIVVTYRPGAKCEVTTPKSIPTELRYRSENISEVLKGKTGAAVKRAVDEVFPEFAADCPEGINITQAKAYLAERISLLPPEGFQIVNNALPSGIPTSITKLLPEPIYIPAVKNLSDDLKTSQSTSFGRLIGLLLDGMMPDLAGINESLSTLDALLNRALVSGQMVDERHEKVRSLERQVENLLSENFPLARVELNIPRPELKTILSAAQIYVDDGSRDLIDNKGDGIKRSLTFALLQTYVAQLNDAEAEGADVGPSPRPLIFLFEEPELYLHPKSQRVLFRTLARISASYQVLVTTHSPLFFEPGVTASFVRVAKEAAEPKPVGKLYPVEFALNAESAEVFRLAKFENADAGFFSRCVVLFEGESDDAYCRHIAKLLKPEWDFDVSNIALVRVSGKGNFAKFRKFFTAFGIEVKIVADLDAIFDGFNHLGAPAAATLTRSTMLQTLDAQIAGLGLAAEPAARQIKAKVQQDVWRASWSAAKETVRQIRAGEVPDQEALDRLDALFIWEHDVVRVSACRNNEQCRSTLTTLLDELREAGICVLSRGAIEDYYPAGAATAGAKPERAIGACRLVTDLEVARGLSSPLSEGRQCELEEIFAELFRQ